MSNQRSGDRASSGVNGKPVKRKRRKPFIPTPFHLVIMVPAAVLVTVLICIGFVKSMCAPYLIGAQQAAIIAAKTDELKTLDAQNDQLERQSIYLSRQDGMESAARNLGYLKPGEQSLVIETTPSSGATAQ